jgi:serine/threonine-protein kinase
VLRDRYRLDAVLGEGAHGVTYLARHLFLDHPCVVKVLPQRVSDASDGAVRRMRAEASAGFRVNDPCVVRVLDCDVANGSWFFVMEYVEGRSLAEIVEAQIRLPWQQVARVAEEAAAGLGAIHRCRLLHRDIKPANLILGLDGRTRVGDLGVVAFMREKNAGGEIGLLGQAGTWAYIAPEMLDPRATVDERSDLYSLGVTLFELLTARLPFGGGFFRSLIDSQNRPPRWPDDAPAEVPTWLREAVLRLLARDPRERPASCDELRDRLSAHQPRRIPAPPSAATGEIGKPSGVAIPVFDNSTSYDADAWLGHALADHLGRGLARIPGVFVADRDELASVLGRLQSADEARPPRLLDAAWLIGASTVVEGRFAREGDQIRIAVTARRFDEAGQVEIPELRGGLADLIGLEDALLQRVVEALRLGAGGVPAVVTRVRPIGAQEAFFSGKRAYFRGDYEQAIELARRAVALDPEFAEAIGFMGVCLSKMGRYEEALELHNRQAEIGQTRDDPREIVEARSNIGAMHYFRGEYALAHDSFARAAATAEKHGLSTELAKIANNLGFVLFHLGRPEEAQAAYLRAIATHRAHGALTSLIGPYNGMGNILGGQGRHEEAAEYYRRALALAEESDDRVNAGICHMYLGRFALAQGRTGDAKHELALSLNILEETRFWNGLARVYESMADMNLHLKNSTEARRCADKRIELARLHSNRRMEAAAWKQKAAACNLAGCRAEAAACLAQAEALSPLQG